MAKPKKKKILLIDDEPSICRLMKSRLERYGYEVETAMQAAEGIEKAKKYKPEVIVLDHLMPKVTGIQACREIKQINDLSKIPVLIFTCHTKTGFEEECKNAGAAAVIYKPTVAALLEFMDQAFRGKTDFWEDENAF